jgi:hypothetical protein
LLILPAYGKKWSCRKGSGKEECCRPCGIAGTFDISSARSANLQDHRFWQQARPRVTLSEMPLFAS